MKSFTSKIHKLLEREFGKVSCPLSYNHPHELSIAVILSAQCTDDRVNQVTPLLFKSFPTLESFANVELPELEKIIHSTGFYKNKAKSIKGFAQKLIINFNGQLPKTIEELTTLPGFGRKTANVVLNEIYGISEGIVVDTHVKRISKLLKLTKFDNPEKIEKDLMNSFVKDQWQPISLYFIFLGRKYCKARHQDCDNCPLQKICPSAKGVGNK